MAAAAGRTPGVEEKARAFSEYLHEIGLPGERVLGDLGPVEVEDVVSFFYDGMPDRFKGGDGRLAYRREATPLPEEHWCTAAGEAAGLPHRAA